MSHFSDIRTGVKSALTDTFTGADIYTREPLDEDWDRSKLNLWVYIEGVEADEQPFVSDFRVHHVIVVAKRRLDGRSKSASATDTVTDDKGNDSDDIKEALSHCLPNGIHAISNVYHVDFVTEESSFDQHSPEYEEDIANIFSQKLSFNFYTYESNLTTLLAYDESTFILAYDGETKLRV
jgi:hypothetical protein